MKLIEIAHYRETGNQWLTDLLGRRDALSIQLAKVDDEIGIVRGALRAHGVAKTKGVSQDREP
jgi:hypothetical protein